MKEIAAIIDSFEWLLTYTFLYNVINNSYSKGKVNKPLVS